ncbi:hypothetical protein N657DRAFT_656947 [Parathielavia appendiculata]|uniref:Apc15p protein-domain-containing protein n=1 Tax=Parathielavia appendiculata TaxID=2587402 RepID=A0AAN6Z2X2_9PEZI|nr:hypothetical protein N657DRAFT_656947 [Parathielavia appendiculata]
MFSVLPDLTPRESHSLWYTSSRHPSSLYPTDPPAVTTENTTTITIPTTTTTTAIATQNTPVPNPSTTPAGTRQGPNAHHQSPSATAQIIDRSLLGRLHAEEQLMERRRAAVTNLGSTWLKPPGVTKTLFQMREERREAEEHAEALRREMLAQELAAAEAEAQAQAAAALQAGEEGLGDIEGDGEDDFMEAEEAGRDLDEEIPNADAEGFGYDGVSDDEEGEDEDEEDEEDEEEEEELSEAEQGMSSVDIQQRRQEIAHMRAREERMRQMMVRGAVQRAHALSNLYSGEEDISDDERGQLLDEDTLYRDGAHQGSTASVGAGSDMDMGANLDDDIPEAEGGGYEHTDSEASLNSNGDHDISYARSSRILHHRSSLRRSEAPRSSLDISGLLSGDGSSIAGSSPHIRRGNF